MPRKICLVTGSRAEYGLSYPILRAIQNHPDLELQLIVTGMHLLPVYGNTIDIIKKDGFKINAKIKNQDGEKTSGTSMAKAIAKCIEGLANHFQKNKPDIIISMTDLGFSLAAAIVGSHMNIPVAHVHGGDVSGSVDDAVRHATTKFAHIHFPISKQSADRIIKMGEDPSKVYNVGAPGLDNILNQKLYSEKKIRGKYNIAENSEYIIFIQHPVSLEEKQSKVHYIETLLALEELKIPTILIYPNSDAGSSDVIELIESKKIECIKPYKNLDRKEYLSLLKYASVLVGNSSSGILEAPSFHLPVVNIGTRQKGRERAGNVIDTGYNREEILNAIKIALADESFREQVSQCRSPYGNGTAGKQIANILSTIILDHSLLEK